MGTPPSSEGQRANRATEEVEQVSGRVQTDPLTEAEGLDLVGILSAID